MPVSLVTVQRPNLIGGGTGLVQIGSVSSPPAGNMNLQDVGSIEGGIQENLVREYREIWDKQPLVLVRREVVKEYMEISFVLKEIWVKDLTRFFGLNPTSKVVEQGSGSETITDEIKVLWGTYPARLYGRNISSVSYVSASSGGSSPYSSSDYSIDTTEGTIRRTSSSSIPDGGSVYLKYTYTRPKRRYINLGGDSSVNSFYLRIIYIQPDGNRHIYDYYKVVPRGGLVLVKSDAGINKYRVNLIALADIDSKSAGNYYGTRYYEYTGAA